MVNEGDNDLKNPNNEIEDDSDTKQVVKGANLWMRVKPAVAKQYDGNYNYLTWAVLRTNNF